MYLHTNIVQISKMASRGITPSSSSSTKRSSRSSSTISSSSAIRWSLQVVLVLILNQIHRNFGSPVFTYNPSVTQFHIQSGRNIRHLPCVVRRSGIEGVCMFAIDCIKANGTHLGTCIDRFYFGSCCQLKDDADIVESEIVENSIDQNTIPHFSFGSPITSTTVSSFHSTASSSSSATPSRITTTTPKGHSTSLKPTVTSTTHHQKVTTSYHSSSPLPSSTPPSLPPSISLLSSHQPETTTVKYVPIIATTLNSESKTEASNEQPIIEKLSETTVRIPIATKLPTTTEENIKLQTFQSVQETTFTSPSPTPASSTVTKKPSRRTTTTTTPSKITVVQKTTPVPKTTAQSIESTASSTVASSSKPRPSSTTISTTQKVSSVQSSTKPTPTTSATLSKRPEQTQTTKPTAKPIPQKTTSNRPIVTASTEKHFTTAATQSTPTKFASTAQPTIITSSGTRPTPPQKKKPLLTTLSFVSSAITTPLPKFNATKIELTTTTTTTTQMPDLVTWSNAEPVKTEHPPEWILIPSVTQSPSTVHTTFSSTFKPAITSSAVSTETTRFPTRKPIIVSSSKAPITVKKPITAKPSPIETATTKPSTKKPQTTTTTVASTTSTTTTTEKLPVTTTTPKLSTTVLIGNTESDEELQLTTQSVTMYDEFEGTTFFTEISETENAINHATSAVPSYTQSSSIGSTTISMVNSTAAISSTEASSSSSSSSSSSITFTSPSTENADHRTSTKPVESTTQQSVTLTTILLPPSIKPEYEKLPTLKPVSDTKEKEKTTTTSTTTTTTAAAATATTTTTTTTTTTSTTVAPSIMDTSSNTIAYNKTSPQPIEPIVTTEASDKFTTFINRIETTTGEAFTVPDIATDSVPLTTFETYEVENTTAENVTLEFVDLPTTEAISSTASISQYLETANYKQVCGKRMYPEPRIVGGSKASFGRWPWQISLRQWRTSTYLHKCGAALLNENWAITAAHCVDNVPPSDLLLRLGEYDLAEEEEPYLYQERRVQIVASHPQFDPRTFEYDLALLRFYEPVVFQPNIIPVCVPESDENFIGRTAFVTGWGRLYEDGPLPSVLQEVSVPVINNTLCEGMYRNAGYIEHIPHIFICAGWRKGGYDSCEGDSGGPMVIQRDDKRFLLAGVISWGIGCAEPNQPGVYTRISEFREWINQILQF